MRLADLALWEGLAASAVAADAGAGFSGMALPELDLSACCKFWSFDMLTSQLVDLLTNKLVKTADFLSGFAFRLLLDRRQADVGRGRVDRKLAPMHRADLHRIIVGEDFLELLAHEPTRPDATC